VLFFFIEAAMLQKSIYDSDKKTEHYLISITYQLFCIRKFFGVLPGC